MKTEPKACFNCGEEAIALGLCSMHYARLKRGRPLDAPIFKPRDLSRTVSVCLSPELVEQLTTLAKPLGIGLSEIIRTVLEEQFQAALTKQGLRGGPEKTG